LEVNLVVTLVRALTTGDYLVCEAWGSFVLKYQGFDQVYHDVGGIAILLGDQATLGEETTENDDFGYLNQSPDCYGRLRDRGVVHLHSAGRIECSQLALVSEPAGSSGEPPNVQIQYGRLFLDVADVPYLASEVVTWGNDASTATQFTVGTGSIRQYGIWFTTEPYDVALSEEIVFDGDYARIVRSLHVDETVVVGGTNVEPYDQKTVTFLKLAPQEGRLYSSAYRDYPCSRDQDGTWVVTLGSYTWPVVDFPPNLDAILEEVPWVRGFPHMVPKRELGTPGGVSETMDEVERRLSSVELLRYVESTFSYNHPGLGVEMSVQDYRSLYIGEMSRNISEQQDYVSADMFLAAFDLANIVQSLKKWESLARKLADLLASPRSAELSRKKFRTFAEFVKWLANVNLGVEYGILPSVSDARSAFEGILKFANAKQEPNRYHTRRSSQLALSPTSLITTVETLVAEVDKTPKDFLEGFTYGYIRELRRWGIYPGVETLWDVIPFSFVLDWFVDVGKAAATYDLETYIQYFPISHVCWGTRRTWSVQVTDLWPDLVGLSGEVQFILYTRQILQELPLPFITLEEGDGPMDHWTEGLSLVVSRRRR